jgi:hypothetical protein
MWDRIDIVVITTLKALAFCVILSAVMAASADVLNMQSGYETFSMETY